MNTYHFFSGIAATTFLASGVFFLKFWRASRDSFFLLFGGACGLIALERVAALFVHGPWDSLASNDTDSSSWIYLIRMTAFLLILFAIISKNRKEKRP